MADELAQVSSRGTITLPADLRRRLGLREGDVMRVRISGSSVVLTPVALTPIELYTEERLAEFAEASRMSDQEIASARSAWGIPPTETSDGA